MRSARLRGIAALALVSLSVAMVTSSAHAQRTREPLAYLPDSARVVAAPRPTGIILAQEQIGAGIELGRVLGNNASGGGMLGALIIASMDRTVDRLRANANARGDVLVAPIRTVLPDGDAERYARDATLAAVSQNPWLNAAPAQVLASTADNAQQVAADFNRANAAAQPILVEWRYQISPDASQVQVFAALNVAGNGRNAVHYRQQVVSIVKLENPSFVPEENVARWVANSGAPVRRALEMAFSRAGESLARVVNLDREAYLRATDRRRPDQVVAVGYRGPILFQDAHGPVFWAQDSDQNFAAFVAVQSVTE